MHEILFRGKRTDNHEWVEGSLFQSEGQAAIGENGEFSGCYILEKEPLDVRFFMNGNSAFVDNEFIQVSEETVGQFTALCDKNGKKIFEGDIVVQDSEYCSEIAAGDTYWDGVERADFFVRRKGIARIYPSKGAVITKQIIIEKSINGEYAAKNEKQQGACNISQGRCEVIGNIYDNPELMEVESGS